jgi:hypothetical protein
LHELCNIGGGEKAEGGVRGEGWVPLGTEQGSELSHTERGREKKLRGQREREREREGGRERMGRDGGRGQKIGNDGQLVDAQMVHQAFGYRSGRARARR